MWSKRFWRQGVRQMIGLSVGLSCTCLPLHQVQAHSTAAMTVYLTFDDGPSERYTPAILDILKREHVHATFFVLGQRVEQFPRISKRVILEGHEIGNHGFGHDFLREKEPTFVLSDVNRADSAIASVTGQRPRYYRPPGGIISPMERSSIQQMGHPIALWSVDSQDWMTASKEKIVAKVMSEVRPGSIILMHDGVSNSKYTAQALPIIIHRLRAQGYQFRTL